MNLNYLIQINIKKIIFIQKTMKIIQVERNGGEVDNNKLISVMNKKEHSKVE